jgi:hypothetical protein
MDDECVLTCEENYENITGGGEYVCKAKRCDDRTPFANGSCSVKEDFYTEENPVKCYLHREMVERAGICTSQCFSHYLHVYHSFFLFLFYFYFYFFCLV